MQHVQYFRRRLVVLLASRFDRVAGVLVRFQTAVRLELSDLANQTRVDEEARLVEHH